MSITLTLNPYRCSREPERMRAFLELLGLRTLLSGDGGYALLRAGAGLVAVHPSGPDRSGETQLSFYVESAERAARELRAAGLEPVVWDESYGRHAGITEPCGGGVWINEEMHDLYGHRRHETVEVDSALAVVAVRSSDDFARDRRFFETLGFRAQGPGDEWWQELRGPAGTGVIGLHAPHGEASTRPSPENPITGRDPLVGLGFETGEPLERLAERLVAAGHEARLVQEPKRSVHVVDPDGRQLEIHPAPEVRA